MALTWSRSIEWNAEEWRKVAACRDTELDLFFPIGTTGPAIEHIKAAKSVCTECEVKGPCLEFALVTNQESGVWGGTAEEERRQLRKIWLSRQAGQGQINQMSKLRLSNRKPIHGQEQLNGSRRRRLG